MSLLLDLMTALRSVKPCDLPTIPRMVLVVVADHWSEKEQRSWPMLETIALEAGCSKTAARIALRQLVKAGWLTVITEANPRASARFGVNLTGRPVERGAPDAPQGSSRRTSAKTEGRHVDLRGLADAPLRSATRTPEVRHVELWGAPDAPEAPTKLPVKLPYEAPSEALMTQKTPSEEKSADGLKQEPTEAKGEAKSTGQLPLVDLPPSSLPPLKPSPTKRKVSLPAEPDPSVLDPKQRAVYDAIVADPSLRPICPGPVQLAVDLCSIAPLVDVPLAVKSAGAWMRGDPTDRNRRKTKGNSFLANWVTRENDRLAALPQPAKPVEQKPYKPPVCPKPWEPPKDLNPALVAATRAELFAKYGPLESANGKRETA